MQNESNLDRWARMLHEAYCANDDEACSREPGRARATANVPWDGLPETYRRSNRASAERFSTNLGVLGRQVAAAGTEPEVLLSFEELETLARMEHERWMSERALDGWVHGSIRDNVRKFHPDMIPYERLSEDIKQLDRDKVNEMIELVRREGLVISYRESNG